jgi:uncharacterized DUF497 family protein
MLCFEWAEKKNRSHRRKHAVWFEEAQSAFRDPNFRLSMIQNTQTTRIGLSSAE